MKIRNLILLFLGLFFLTTAYGERISEFRNDASHVLVGEVTKVFKSDGKEYVGYVVRIQVEALEKGTGPAKGQHFYAECFERIPHIGPGTPAPGASGHSGVPKVGDRVRIFTNEKKAIYEGVYPNWYYVLAGSAVVQPEKHPEAEKAMANIVLQKDFGKQLKFHSREVVTVAKNDKVPGLNGLMFMRWKGDDSSAGVEATVVWFEKKDDLLKFYASTTQGNDYKLGEFNGTRIWKIGKDG